jgi:hypothetical protein
MILGLFRMRSRSPAADCVAGVGEQRVAEVWAQRGERGGGRRAAQHRRGMGTYEYVAPYQLCLPTVWCLASCVANCVGHCQLCLPKDVIRFKRRGFKLRLMS